MNTLLSNKSILAFFSVLTAALIVSSTPVLAADQHSPKKGFDAVNWKKSPEFQKRLEKLNISWMYDWGARPPVGLPKGVEFVPMVWGYYGKKTESLFPMLKKEYEAGKIHYLLGYNEPDHKDQSNMSVEKALKTWHLFEETGIPLGGPAAANPLGPWQKPFMKAVEAKHMRVDFVCVHSYGGPNAKAFLARLKKIHELYHRPIWITEFAVADWKAKKEGHNRFTPEQVQAFMKAVLPALDRLPWVQRYAWFSFGQSSLVGGPSALFKPDGSLTKLGKIYAAH